MSGKQADRRIISCLLNIGRVCVVGGIHLLSMSCVSVCW